MTETDPISENDAPAAVAAPDGAQLQPFQTDFPSLEVEVIDEEDEYPNLFERRIPDEGPPYPEGLADALGPQLIDTARYYLIMLTAAFWSPASLARLGRVWQWRKFDFLDWLRPIELLLRRLLLIEAITLIISQVLPASRAARAGKKGPRAPRSRPPFDPDYPETWRVSFSTVPAACWTGPRRMRRRLPPINPDHFRGDPITPLRYRRKMHDALPLALRLEAAIRVTLDPARYARRLAFRLRQRRNPNVSLLIIPRRPFRRPAPRDALFAAGERGAVLHGAWWSSA
jgi:hypothetical protein